MRLNRGLRHQINALLDAGHSQKTANQLGISPGGLSKELLRNGGREKYDPDRADKANKHQLCEIGLSGAGGKVAASNGKKNYSEFRKGDLKFKSISLNSVDFPKGDDSCGKVQECQ